MNLEEHLIEVVELWANEAEIRNRLTSLGITRATLFPDLDNIALAIKDKILV